MAVWIASAAYVLIAVLVFRSAYATNEDLKQRKHYAAHPERYGVDPTWVLFFVAALWPIQIIGLFVYLLKGK